jgi:hypothetical protein
MHLLNMSLMDGAHAHIHRLWDEDQSVFHLLCSCPSLIFLRKRIFLNSIVRVDLDEEVLAFVLLPFAAAGFL